MKPASFKFVEAADEESLASILSESGSDARLLAGGQSLVPMMNFRLVSPEVLIDLNGVRSLEFVDCDEQTLRIGSLTRHATLEDSEEIYERCPLLTKAVRKVAHRAVRNRGTTGGTLALAYPGAEIPLALMTLDADVCLRSSRGERRMPVSDFIQGALDTALEDDEYIGCVEVRLPPAGSLASFFEASRRHGDFAIGAAAVVARRDEQGRLAYLRAGVGGGIGAPTRLAQLEQAIVEGGGIESVISDAVHEAIGNLEVFGDHHYPEDYRRHVLRGVLLRALTEAIGEERHVQ
jgi:6-hydroxypseudooxynicotine dehydrogenase subunit alpha